MIMDAKELMIDDWVSVRHSHKEPTFERVRGIGTDVVLVLKESGVDVIDVSLVDSIPLTKEMLEKNGFEFFDSSYFNDIVSITFLSSCIYFNCHVYKGEVCDVIERHIDYVHELQHLLRVCELADMANNFKIE